MKLDIGSKIKMMALNIISEYVETELSEKTHTKSKNEKERGDAR